MRLTAPDRRKQLIEAATELFSEHGFDGTSTRQIAEAAGINEALIFRHFPTKEDLFWAVIAEKLEGLGKRRQFQDLLASKREYRDVLVSIAQLVLQRTEEDKALTRLFLYSTLRTGEVSDRFYRTYIATSFKQLADYIQKGIDLGVFREEIDPEVTARAFLGMMIYHNLVQEIMGGERYQKFSVRVLAEQFVDMFLNGITSEENRHKNDVRERKCDVLAHIESD